MVHSDTHNRWTVKVSRERAVLDRSSARGPGLQAGTWQFVKYGFVFTARGLLPTLSAIGVIPATDSKFHAARWVVAVCGGIFVAAGLNMMRAGVRGVAEVPASSNAACGKPGTAMDVRLRLAFSIQQR